MLKLLDVFTDRAAYRPAEPAVIQSVLANQSQAKFRGRVRARLVTLDGDVTQAETEVELAPGARQTVALSLGLPADDLRGYGVEVELVHRRLRRMAQAGTARAVAADWTRAPRYGFLADFAPGESEAESQRRLQALARFHINAVQFYDWMYRHHSFLPPSTEFVDPLGRKLSLDVVARKVRLAQQLGMRAQAYVAIYAAAPDYFNVHPEQGLYRLDGAPYTLSEPALGDWLFITNIADPAWLEQLSAECRQAMLAVGFDGIHLDQYGFVRAGYTLAGERVDVEQVLPEFLNALRSAVGDAPAVFNAVNVWPLKAVAASSLEPLYIEVWPPHDTLRDLREIIQHARDLRGGRAPVLAAYLSDLLSDVPAVRQGGLHALRRLTAAIYLNGGSHIALGEGGAVLRHPYFPNYYRLRPAETRAVRADYDFIARYAEYFFDPAWRDISTTTTGGLNDDLRLETPRFGPMAEPDSIWTIARMRGDTVTLGLINLRGLPGTAWNSAQPAARRVRRLRLRVQLERPMAQAFFASPDYDGGRAVSLLVEREGRLAFVTVPELGYWGLVILRLSDEWRAR
jgi:dextranase